MTITYDTVTNFFYIPWKKIKIKYSLFTSLVIIGSAIQYLASSTHYFQLCKSAVNSAYSVMSSSSVLIFSSLSILQPGKFLSHYSKVQKNSQQNAHDSIQTVSEISAECMELILRIFRMSRTHRKCAELIKNIVDNNSHKKLKS